ncbi:hypothetical protein [Micromonospora sp. NPDC004704]
MLISLWYRLPWTRARLRRDAARARYAAYAEHIRACRRLHTLAAEHRTEAAGRG